MRDERDSGSGARAGGSVRTTPPACPNCGHELSMFVEPPAARSERIAARLAEAAASWRFVVVLLCWVVAWLGLNLALRPFEPYPLVMLAGLAASLATVAALQGPLILLSQRQAAMRDRARDREAFRVAVNTEADLHRLQQRVEVLTERLEAVGPPSREGQAGAVDRPNAPRG